MARAVLYNLSHVQIISIITGIYSLPRLRCNGASHANTSGFSHGCSQINKTISGSSRTQPRSECADVVPLGSPRQQWGLEKPSVSLSGERSSCLPPLGLHLSLSWTVFLCLASAVVAQGATQFHKSVIGSISVAVFYKSCSGLLHRSLPNMDESCFPAYGLPWQAIRASYGMSHPKGAREAPMDDLALW